MNYCTNPNKRSFAVRLIAYLAMETVFHSTTRCFMQHSEIKNIFPAVIHKQVDIIEDHKKDFTLAIYSKLLYPAQPTMIKDLVSNIATIEKEYCYDELPTYDQYYNQDWQFSPPTSSVRDYIEYSADQLLEILNHPKIFHKNNPFLQKHQKST